MGIYFDDLKNVDEYDPEINLVLNCLDKLKKQEEINDMIVNIFMAKFGNIPVECREKLSVISKKLFEYGQHETGRV